jgi:hypothetical protein
MWHSWVEVALLWPTTWHCGGAHLSGDLCLGGAHLLTWTNGRVPHGIDWVRWLLCWELLWVPKFYPECVMSPQVVPREALIKSQPFDLSI